MSDAPRQWYLRLNKNLEALGWERSSLDYACWLLWSEDRTTLDGILLSHVDDLLLGGNLRAQESLLSLGESLGFGPVEYDDFVYCGKRIRQRADGTITISMVEYHQNLKPIVIPAHRRAQPDAELSEAERRQLRAVLGSLQWLVAQLRIDQGFSLSSLQGEKPRVQTLVKANVLLKKFKMHPRFELTFKPLDLDGAGILVITDASLGNVTKEGCAEGSVTQRVFSQSAYFVLVADRHLMSGKEGNFGILDARSHRIPRVCRSTFGAELLGAEEGLDNGQFARGMLALMLGYPMNGRCADGVMDAVPLMQVTDAKDVFDKGSSDTPTYGSQKSLAFTIAWMRSILARPNTCLRWTSTENMFVDAGTKEMDVDHMHRIIQSGTWSVEFNQTYVKQTSKKTKASVASESGNSELVGENLDSSHPIFPFLAQLSGSPGWHFRDSLVIHVAKGAKSYRVPTARFESSDFPLRSTYARFDLKDGRSTWRILEDGVRYTELANKQAVFGGVANILVSIFRSLANKDIDQLKNEAIGKDHA